MLITQCTDLETYLIENPYVVTLCRRNNMVFALGVLISDQFFITADQPINYYAFSGFLSLTRSL